MALLVKYSDNWADEIDVEGYAIYEDRNEFNRSFLEYFDGEFETVEEALESESGCCFCIGSNEEIDYRTIKDFLEHFEFTEITDEESDTIERLFDSFPIGIFPLDRY